MNVIQQNATTERLKHVNRSGMQISVTADGRIINSFAFTISFRKTQVFIFD